MSGADKADLPALPPGVQRSTEVADEAFARILLLGPMKVGKTTSVLSTSPGPILTINCDGVGATKYPAGLEGVDFYQIDATSRATWQKACATAVGMAKAEQVRTIVVDTITLLGDEIVDELKLLQFQGFDLWNELADQLKSGLRKLLNAPAHVIIVAHMDPREDEITGIMPLIPGGTKVWLPSKVADWVLFSFPPEGKRQFVLGPQKSWTHSGRGMNRACTIDADVGKLFAELGITP